ncbi:ribosome small subunit-dependent GTPase A [Dactylosporangium roseum]|uniref:Small ribosomal subunit biogenesis GTPase RsgA n=1 Tax=Dactylosporangium roseum TaxID=47989 RepID=A0ABY5Z333_9ACTN|nr:ribosome small subunit-dependent GTPase A [Dactylosporangium roseum]UWZ36441.1 ribosome small subunit-dependent GTPase A [Dactylosporangium roseum]
MLSSDSFSPRSSPSGGLFAYGWDTELERSFTSHRAAGFIPARIIGVDRGRCDVITETGPTRAGTSLVGASDPVSAPCTGDWAALRSGHEPELTALLPRRSVIVRSSASRSSHGQALAANIDTAALVVSAEVPLNPGRIERLLALAWESGALPVIVLTKADRSADPSVATAELTRLAPGVEIITTSAATGHGLELLTATLTGTVVLLGPSGAGKSTLGNALLGTEVLATGAVRSQDGKGRHTTVRRQMVPLPNGGVLIDTPGLRGIGLFDADDGLQQVFADIERLAPECRFSDCGHNSEPGCAVQAAIASGELSRRRLDSYRKLQRENAWATSRSDARLRAQREDHRKAITRSLRETYTFRDQQGRS